MVGAFPIDQVAKLHCHCNNLGSTGQGNGEIWLNLLAWGEVFWGPALLRGLLSCFRLFHQLGFTWRTPAGPTVLPHRNIAWHSLQCPLGGRHSPIHGGRDGTGWATAEQLHFLPASLPPSLPPSAQGAQHSRPRRPCRATSAFGTGNFQVTVSSVRVKVHPKLLMNWQPLPWWSVCDYPTESLI